MFVQQLDTHTIGYITWRAGLQSSINTTIVHDDGTNQVVIGGQVVTAIIFVAMIYAMVAIAFIRFITRLANNVDLLLYANTVY